jgi:two-component system chemotaxis sensor kinase CheA
VVELSSMVLERRAGSSAPPAPSAPLDADMIQVVVFGHDGAHIGLIVEQILDIVDDRLANPRPPGRPGVLGSVVIAGRVTELLDVESVLRRAQPGAAWAEANVAVGGELAGKEIGHGA